MNIKKKNLLFNFRKTIRKRVVSSPIQEVEVCTRRPTQELFQTQAPPPHSPLNQRTHKFVTETCMKLWLFRLVLRQIMLARITGIHKHVLGAFHIHFTNRHSRSPISPMGAKRSRWSITTFNLEYGLERPPIQNWILMYVVAWNRCWWIRHVHTTNLDIWHQVGFWHPATNECVIWIAKWRDWFGSSTSVGIPEWLISFYSSNALFSAMQHRYYANHQFHHIHIRIT